MPARRINRILGARGKRAWENTEMERLVMGEEGVPPCFCVYKGNKGLTGEWLASRGNKGIRLRRSEGKARRRGKSGLRVEP